MNPRTTATGSENGWLPSLDLHAVDGELILHAEARGAWEDLEISLEEGELSVHSAGEEETPAHSGRLPLPFPLDALPAVCRVRPEILEVRIPLPDESAARPPHRQGRNERKENEAMTWQEAVIASWPTGPPSAARSAPRRRLTCSPS